LALHHCTGPLALSPRGTSAERTPRTLNAHCPLEPRRGPSPGLRPPSPPLGERDGVRGWKCARPRVEPRRASDLHHRILQRADARDADAHRVLRLKGKTVRRNNTSACQQHCAARETLAAKKKGNHF